MKLSLEATYIHTGRTYGPGVVDVDDDAAADIQAAQERRRAAGRAPGAPTETSLVPPSSAATVGEVEAQIEALTARREAMLAAQASQAEADAAAPIPSSVLEKLAAAGYDGAAARTAASDEDLLKVEGVGPATVAKIRALPGA